MLSKPLIVGSKGSMGRRYAAILRTLKIEPLLVDVGEIAPKGFDSVIIASPTDLHVGHCLQFMPVGVPILCEKPMSKSLRAAETICNVADKAGAKIDMVNQYRYCSGDIGTWKDITSYNYFNSGRDGLHWDCISIIALAKDAAHINNDSPIWSCMINGKQLHLSGMDWAYVKMIEKWVSGDLEDHGTDYIRLAHKKVQSCIEGH